MWNRSNPDPKPIAWFQVATVIAVYANFEFAKIQGIGWGWAGVIWLYSFVNFVPLDLFKFAIRYMLSSKGLEHCPKQGRRAFFSQCCLYTVCAFGASIHYF